MGIIFVGRYFAVWEDVFAYFNAGGVVFTTHDTYDSVSTYSGQ